ncbi:MAG: hypothetical protein P1U32_08210, partial [Legionellaceae bacterium]|nr:hypothetical protein [Legionellaceae bacterium]
DYLSFKVMGIAAQYTFEQKVVAYGDVLDALNLTDEDLPIINVILDDVLESAASQGQLTMDVIANMLNRVLREDADFSVQVQVEILENVISNIVYADIRDSQKAQILQALLPNCIEALLVHGEFLPKGALKVLVGPVLIGLSNYEDKLNILSDVIAQVACEDESLSSALKVSMAYELIEEGIRILVDNRSEGALSVEHVSALFSDLPEQLMVEELVQLQVGAIYFILYEPNIETAKKEMLASTLRDQMRTYLERPESKEGYEAEEYKRLVDMVDSIDVNAFKPEDTSETTASYREALQEHTQKGSEDTDKNVPTL